jgi:hypothetical protein
MSKVNHHHDMAMSSHNRRTELYGFIREKITFKRQKDREIEMETYIYIYVVKSMVDECCVDMYCLKPLNTSRSFFSFLSFYNHEHKK